jgi:hypothetical protein
MTDAEALERLKLYASMGDITRRWVSTADTKAAFLSAANAALLAFLWTGLKISDLTLWPRALGMGASACCFASILFALLVVVPRITLPQIHKRKAAYKDTYKAISFWGYVAHTYPVEKVDQFFNDVGAMTYADLAREALEQHHTNCHVVQEKMRMVAISSRLFLVSLAIVIFNFFALFRFAAFPAHAM